MPKKNKISLEVTRGATVPRAAFFNYFEQWSDWWSGFDERDSSRKPTIDEKQKMAMYPIINSIIDIKYAPLLSCHFNLDGDEKQVNYVQHWLDRYYRRCLKLMLQKAITKGMAVGERIIESVNIDNKPYWMHTGSFIPNPDDVQLRFAKDKPEINGFSYSTFNVDRYKENGDWMMPGMVYWNYNGDEVSLPYGDSILNKLYWPWQLVMKTWTSMTVYQRLHSPFLKYFYVPESYGDTDNKATEKGRAQAIVDLKGIKNMQGAGLSLVKNAAGDWVRGPDLDVVAPPDREPQFNESIKLLNTLMYVAMNFPQRLIEQFKDTGSQSLAETQEDFYTQYTVAGDVETHQHFLKTWFLDPMLEVNFGKIDCTVDATVSDKERAMHAKILGALIQSGQTAGILDIAQIAAKSGVPIYEIEKPPTVETTERRILVPGVEFAATKTKGDEKAALKRWAEKVVKVMNKAVEEIKENVYGILKQRLEEQHGKMTPRIDRLFKNGTPNRVDLQKAIQIPNSVYAGLIDHIVEAWDSGQKFHCEHAGVKPMDKPSTQVMQQLRTLDDVFTGSQYLMGEGERLESRLYRVLADVRPDEALSTLNLEFRNYIETTLPLRVRNIVHESNFLGTKDFGRYLQLVKAAKERS